MLREHTVKGALQVVVVLTNPARERTLLVVPVLASTDNICCLGAIKDGGIIV